MMKIPEFESEDKERQFWATHDSVDFLDGAEPVWLEYDWDGEDLKPKQSLQTEFRLQPESAFRPRPEGRGLPGGIDDTR